MITMPEILYWFAWEHGFLRTDLRSLNIAKDIASLVCKHVLFCLLRTCFLPEPVTCRDKTPNPGLALILAKLAQRRDCGYYLS